MPGLGHSLYVSGAWGKSTKALIRLRGSQHLPARSRPDPAGTQCVAEKGLEGQESAQSA